MATILLTLSDDVAQYGGHNKPSGGTAGTHIPVLVQVANIKLEGVR